MDRYKEFCNLKRRIEEHEGSLEKFSKGYERFGINKTYEGVTYREWAPEAKGLYLIGDFSEYHWSCLICIIKRQEDYCFAHTFKHCRVLDDIH